ncbi:MAG: ribonuclease J [Anderseniella sp.]
MPLGGMGEIGMNAYAYGYGSASRRKWIMVDCGVKFGDEMDPGIDVILPDTRYLEAERKSLLGIFLTHGHEDHLGAVAWLWPQLRCPVYCTPFAAELLKRKLAEAGLLGEVPLRVVPLGGTIEIGDFSVEFVSVTHSIPESSALYIKTPAGKVLHSGDWKLDPKPTIAPLMDIDRLKQIGDEGVDALVCDSTNVLREGHSPSESEIADNLAHIIAEAKGRVAVTTFASHVGRITSVAQAARANQREVVLAGRAMHNIVAAAMEVGLLKEGNSFRDQTEYGYLPRDKVVLLCTGSQGELRAAMARIAADNHPDITLNKGDLVIFSSKTIPGNEKSVATVLNRLAEQEIDVITSDDALVHTSGHPRQEELRLFYSWVKPKLLVPMHGEMRHLVKHRAFATECGIPATAQVMAGEILRLAPGEATIVDEVPAGRIHVDGRILVPSVDGPARKRRKLSQVGLVAISLVIDGNGRLVDDPQAKLDGLPEETSSGEEFFELVLDVVDEVYESIPRKRRLIDEVVEEKIRQTVRSRVDNEWGKKPIVHVLIHRV